MIHHETDLLAQAKQRLPLPALMAQCGHGDRAKKSARCMFHEDSHNSFSTYQRDDGSWGWKCHAGCGGGDEADWLAKRRGLSNADACREFIRLAGVNTPRSQPSTRDSQPPFDWPQCVRDFTPDHVANFAKWRALGPEFVAWLHSRQLVGLFRNRLAFPVHDASGAVVRAHVRVVKRQPGGSENVFWFYTPKGPGLPLVIGAALTASTVWAFESQFDMLAALDLAGWHNSTDGLPGIAAIATRGAENGKRLTGLFSPAATLVLFPQNDSPRADRAETPAQKWTREAAAHCGCKTVQLVTTPGDFKDLNDALRAGLTPEEFQATRAAAQPYTPPPDLHAAPPRNVSKPVVTLPPEDEADAADTLQPFPIESLPPAMACFVAAVSRCERVPVALPAVCALSVASAAIGAGLEVASGPNRTTRGNIFALASAESGSGKSETFRLIAAPLTEHQTQLLEVWRQKTSPQLQSEIRVLDKEIGTLEKKAAKSTDLAERDKMLGELEFKLARKDELARQAAMPCIIAQDVTTERLAVLLRDNREVILSASADARKLVDNLLGRYNPGKTTDESLYLSAYSGDMVRVDRQGRDAVILNRPCLSLCWFVQPDLLATMLDEQSLSVSGFLPRLLICHTQATPRKIEGEPQFLSESTRGQWAQLITDLLAAYHDAAKSQRIGASPEAVALLNGFHNRIVDRRTADLADVGAFAARYAENAWRLSVVLHAAFHGPQAHTHLLDQETAASAIGIVEWFMASQLDILAKGRRAAAEKLETEVLELLETHRERKGQDFITARDVQRARIVPSADAARVLLARMESDGVLIGEDVKPEHGGKATRIFRRVQNPVPE